MEDRSDFSEELNEFSGEQTFWPHNNTKYFKHILYFVRGFDVDFDPSINLYRVRACYVRLNFNRKDKMWT